MNTIIEKIRAEIERRIKSWQTIGEHSPEGQGKDTCVSRVTELTDLLSFLSVLEKEEKPMNPTTQEQPVCEGLEEEYKNYVEDDPVYSKLVNRVVGLSIARHFAKWGAEHLKNED